MSKTKPCCAGYKAPKTDYLVLSPGEVDALCDLVTYLWDDESQDCEEWGNPVGHIFHSVRTCNKALERAGRAVAD